MRCTRDAPEMHMGRARVHLMYTSCTRREIPEGVPGLTFSMGHSFSELFCLTRVQPISTGQSGGGAALLSLAMSELQTIETALGKAASRRRWARALRGLW